MAEKLVLAIVYVVMQVTGSTGGTCTVPLHEVPLLRKKIRDIKGESADFALDERNKPGWPKVKDRDTGALTDVDLIPRVKGMTIHGFADEWKRLSGKYQKYQIKENVHGDALGDIYGTQSRLAEVMRKQFELFKKLSAADHELSVDEWKQIERLASPATELLELDEIDLGASLQSTNPSEQKAIAGSAAATSGSKDRDALAGFEKHLLAANWKAETVAAALELVKEQGLELEAEDIVGAKLPSIGASVPMARSLKNCIDDFVAAAAVGGEA
jgi:hypothetical protein